jgi:hypothetical protein
MVWGESQKASISTMGKGFIADENVVLAAMEEK